MSSSKERDPFYIGYLSNAPSNYARFLRWLIPLLFVIGGVLAFVFVNQQKGFADSTFELGNLTEVEGYLTLDPVPMLKINIGRDAKGYDVFKSIILVGFGKMGAAPTVTEMEARSGQALNGKKIKVRGTLIYYDGKTLLELTKGDASLVSVSADTYTINTAVILGPQKLRGEIVDPKCYFGVMKPGEGKAHRSCAARCLSGGIPPVLKVKKEGEPTYEYYLLQGIDGPDRILDKIGRLVTVEGDVTQRDDWYVLDIAGEDAIKNLTFLPLEETPFCHF